MVHQLHIQLPSKSGPK